MAMTRANYLAAAATRIDSFWVPDHLNALMPRSIGTAKYIGSAGAKLMPRMIVGFTDAPYFRERGAVAYGFGLFSRALTAEAMAGRFHGNDERIDVDSLALTTRAWLEVCEQFLG